MTRRLVKEIRQLALWPAAATVLLFAVSPLLEGRRWIGSAFLLYFLLAVFVPAARLFGAEFDQRTIERLLSQPMARKRIWREKLLALTLTTALSFAALQLARRLFGGPGSSGVDLVLCLVAFTGGPLVSLYTRQSFLGLWGAISLLAVPFWIWLFLVYLTLGHFHVGFFWVHIPPMFLYAPIAYVAGRRLFLSLELDQGASRNLGIQAWFRARTDSTFGPTARLVLKEVQIQGSNLLMLPAVVVLWGVIYGLALAPGPGFPDPLGVLRSIPSGLLIFVFPLVLGATALAGERQMGLADWHSSLPVSRGRQWWVKVLVVMSLAVAAGPGLGGFLDRMLFTLLEARQIASLPFPKSAASISVISAAAGLYASSRAREPVRAVMGGVALLGLTLVPALSPAALEMRGDGLRNLLFPRLPGAEHYLGVALPTLALLAFAFANFRPEPWHWEEKRERALQWVVLGGLLLTIGFW
jgi:ABC-type transport system involved in multi-copper enzyme maturation permease subunit